MNTRRQFLFGLGAAAASSYRPCRAAASDRIRVAMIGVRGQGRALTGRFAAQPNAEVVYLCDVDDRVYGRAAEAVEQKTGKRPPHVRDLRRVLDDKNVDAVVIATPDHWHAPAAILACAAGKDVYVEKPASHNFREGHAMIDAARRYKRVMQVGTQSRSRASTLRAIEYVRSGKLGKVLMAKAWNCQMRENIGHKTDAKPPTEVDWELWTGPAPMLPFNENRFHYRWHWNWNYGTGDAGNDGVHQLDIARWALEVEWPVAVTGMARKLYFDDDQQTPDTMNITFDYGAKALQFEMRIWNPYGLEDQENGVAVYGLNATVQIGRWKGHWGWKVFDEKGKLAMDQTRNDDDSDADHQRNFLDCVKSRKRPNADIAIGHASSCLPHFGNIVARTGRAIRFDASTGSIPGDPDANRLLGREYRRHWATPRVA